MEGKNEIIEEAYLKKEKPTQARSNKKGGYGKQNQQTDKRVNNNEEMFREIMKKREEEDLAAEKAKAEAAKKQISVPSKQEYEEKVTQLNELLPGKFSNGKIKDALRKCNMDVSETFDYLSQAGNSAEKEKKKDKSDLIRIPVNSNSPAAKKPTEEDSEELDLIAQVKKVLLDLADSLILEALYRNDRDVEKTINYLLTNYEQVMEASQEPEFHAQSDLNSDLEEILKQMHEEEMENDRMEQEKLLFFLSQEVDESEIDDDESLGFVEFKRNLSTEEQENPEVIQLLKKTSAYLQQIELYKQQSEKKMYEDYQNEKGELYKRMDYFADNLVRTQQVQKEQFIMKNSDFPSIQKQPSNGGPNIVRELTKNRPKEYNCHQNQWSQNVAAMFQTDEVSALGQQYLQQLSTDFPHVDQELLIEVFLYLKEDYQATQTFILQEFGRSNVTTKVTTIKKASTAVPPPKKERIETEESLLENEKHRLEDQFGVFSKEELRAQIQSTTQLNRVFQIASKQGDTLQKLNLQKRFMNTNSFSLDQMKKYFKVLFLIDARSIHPMNMIDLHGLGKEEALEVVKDQIMYLQRVAQQKRYSELQVSNNFINLEIITGQGLHSQNGSVLKPLVSNFLKRAQYLHKVSTGSIHVKIPF